MNVSGPFHLDEIEAQRRAGGGPSGNGIRTFLPERLQTFFAALPHLFVAIADAEGWPLATILTGPPGFVSALDAQTLQVAASPHPFDPATAFFEVDRRVGLLGFDFSTRRRNRANGVITSVRTDGWAMTVEQSFGNCAKYIQVRHAAPCPRTEGRTETFETLDPEIAAFIASSDTFFVATRSRGESTAFGGMDVSHRGGRPGFVRVAGNRLSIPDFPGNRYYNTFGNLLGDARTGLLFLDFASGDIVQIQGNARIEWSVALGAVPTGAERAWHVDVVRGWRRREALPFAWSAPEPAPTSIEMGVWSE